MNKGMCIGGPLDGEMLEYGDTRFSKFKEFSVTELPVDSLKHGDLTKVEYDLYTFDATWLVVDKGERRIGAWVHESFQDGGEALLHVIDHYEKKNKRYPGERWHNVNDLMPNRGVKCKIAWILDQVERVEIAEWNGHNWTNRWTPTHWQRL